MVKALSEKEVITHFGSKKSYMNFCKVLSNEICETKEFKESIDPLYVQMSLYKIPEFKGWVLFQVLIDKSLLPFIDFKIINVFISNNKEEIINKHLDTFNEIKNKGGNINFLS